MTIAGEPVLGYSWPVFAPKFRDSDTEGQGGVRRFHVCPACITPTDKPDVTITRVPRLVQQRPTCYRCGVPLGIYAQ